MMNEPMSLPIHSTDDDNMMVVNESRHQSTKAQDDESCKIGYFCLRKRSLFEHIIEFLDRNPEGATREQIRNALGLSVQHMERISVDLTTLKFPVKHRKEGNSTVTKFFCKSAPILKKKGRRVESIEGPHPLSNLKKFRHNFVWNYINDRHNEVSTARAILYALREKETKTLGITTKTDRKTVFRILNKLEKAKKIQMKNDLLPEEIRFTNWHKGGITLICVALPSLEDFEGKIKVLIDEMLIKYSKPRGKSRQQRSIETNKRKRDSEDDSDDASEDDIANIDEVYKKDNNIDMDLDNDDEEEDFEEDEVRIEEQEEETAPDIFVDQFLIKSSNPSINLTDLLTCIDHECLFTSTMCLHRLLLNDTKPHSAFTIYTDFKKWPVQFMVTNYKLPLPYYEHLVNLKGGYDKTYKKTKEYQRFSPVDSCLLSCIRGNVSIEEFYRRLATISKLDFYLFIRFIPKQLGRQMLLLMSLGLLIPASEAFEDKVTMMSKYSHSLLRYSTLENNDIDQEIANLMSTSYVLMKEPCYVEEEFTLNNLHSFWSSEIKQVLLHRPHPRHFISLDILIDQQKGCLFFRSKWCSDINYSKRASALVSTKKKYAIFTSLKRSNKHLSNIHSDPFYNAFLKHIHATPLGIHRDTPSIDAPAAKKSKDETSSSSSSSSSLPPATTTSSSSSSSLPPATTTSSSSSSSLPPATTTSSSSSSSSSLPPVTTTAKPVNSTTASAAKSTKITTTTSTAKPTKPKATTTTAAAASTSTSSHTISAPKSASLQTRSWGGFMFALLSPLVRTTMEEPTKVNSFGERVLQAYSQVRSVGNVNALEGQQPQVCALDILALAHLSLLQNGIVDSRITLSTSSSSCSSDNYVEDYEISYLSSQKKSSNYSNINLTLQGTVGADEANPAWKSMGMIKSTLVYSKIPPENTINSLPTHISKDSEGIEMDVVSKVALDSVSDECPWRTKSGAVNQTLLNNMRTKVVSVLTTTPGSSCEDICSAMAPISIEHTKLLLESMRIEGLLTVKYPSHSHILLNPFDKIGVAHTIESKQNAYFLKSF